MLSLEQRPQRFVDMAGQDLVKKSLMHICKDPLNAPKCLLLEGAFGTGKCQPKNAIIPTPYGDRRFGDLQVGDYVFGSDGKPTKVLGIYNRGLMDVYRVHFSDGSYLDVGKDHLWTIRATRSHPERYDVKYLENIIDTKTILNYLNNEDVKLFDKSIKGEPYIQLVKSLEYEEIIEPKCDPYVLGALIADGTLGNLHHLHWTKKEQSVIDEMSKRCNLYKNEDNYNFYISKDKNESIWNALDHYDLLGKASCEKFIPKELFQMSIENRILLLQGLMDGDGSLTHYDRQLNSLVKYGTTSEQLANDFVRLVTSLGGYAEKYYESCDTCWYIKFNVSFNPFLSSSFRDRFNVSTNFRCKRYFDFIEILEPQEMQCILVESEDHLYVGDTQFNIVTHNTTAARIFAKALNCPNQVNGDCCNKPDCPICGKDIQNSMFYTEYDSAVMGNVESVKDLRNSFYFGYDKGYKVIVIDEVHLVSKQAQGALLKIFEEPEPNIFFILCTTDPDKLLPTIVSRSLELRMNTISKDQMLPYLQKVVGLNKDKCEGISDEELNKNLELICDRSHGHMRNAMMLLDSMFLLKEDFKDSVKSAELLYIKLFTLAYHYKEYVSKSGEEKVNSVIIDLIQQLTAFMISDLKSDYEVFVLNLIKNTFTDNVNQNYAGLVVKNSFNLINIFNDSGIYKLFVDDSQFQIAMLILINKLKGF